MHTIRRSGGSLLPARRGTDAPDPGYPNPSCRRPRGLRSVAAAGCGGRRNWRKTAGLAPYTRKDDFPAQHQSRCNLVA